MRDYPLSSYLLWLAGDALKDQRGAHRLYGADTYNCPHHADKLSWM